jgi:hypothetical protein
MTSLVAAANGAAPASPDPPRPARSRKPALATVLADPRVRLCAGAAVIVVTALAARRERVGPREAGVFRAVNDLPGSSPVPIAGANSRRTSPLPGRLALPYVPAVAQDG